jgi:hypothetical protein
VGWTSTSLDIAFYGSRLHRRRRPGLPSRATTTLTGTSISTFQRRAARPGAGTRLVIRRRYAVGQAAQHGRSRTSQGCDWIDIRSPPRGNVTRRDRHKHY